MCVFFFPVRRYSSPPTCGPVLGDHWEVQSDQVLHSSDGHSPADEVRTGTAAEVRAFILWMSQLPRKILIFQSLQQETFETYFKADRCTFFFYKFPNFQMEISSVNFERPYFLCKRLLSGEVKKSKCMNRDVSDSVWTRLFIPCQEQQNPHLVSFTVKAEDITTCHKRIKLII